MNAHSDVNGERVEYSGFSNFCIGDANRTDAGECRGESNYWMEFAIELAADLRIYIWCSCDKARRSFKRFL